MSDLQTGIDNARQGINTLKSQKAGLSKSQNNYCEACGVKLESQKDHRPNCSKQLAKENRELRQELDQVKQQLSEVLTELKKLKEVQAGKNNDKLDQQITHNEKLMADSEKVSPTEMREQVNKSQALLREAKVNNTMVTPKGKQNNGNSGSLSYVMGGSVVVISALLACGYCLLKKNKKK